jgi:hypothetical protein
MVNYSTAWATAAAGVAELVSASGLLVVISSAWLTALLTPVAFAADA